MSFRNNRNYILNDDLFDDEEHILLKIKVSYQRKELDYEKIEMIISEYEDLLIQSRIVTKVSDRIQHKLDAANEKIQVQNNQINKKNNELKHTIKELAKARLRKKASTLMLCIFIGIFFIEEFFIDRYLENVSYIFWIGIAIKLTTAFILKSLEGSLEHFLLNLEQRRILKKTNMSIDKNEILFRYYRIKFINTVNASRSDDNSY